MLKIETKNRIRKVENPVKSREIDLGIWSIIQILNEEDCKSKWHFVGHSLYREDALVAVEKINNAIEENKEYIFLEYIS